VLHPGDVVRLRIWREPEWSGDFRVDEAGMVVLPKIGPLRVTDEAPDALKARLAETYRSYLSHASVDVVLLRRVQVLGAVRTPGLYDVDPAMKVSDVLALAGGATTQGNLRRIRLIRGGHAVTGALTQESVAGAAALRSGDQIFVPDRSWLSRNPGIITAVLSATVSLTLALLR
jgi:polysaccharide export outer membrane protein